MKNKIKICISGIGRIGNLINKYIMMDNKLIVKSKIKSKTKNIKEKFNDIDIVIDFSNRNQTKKILPLIRKYNKKLIIGTTGLKNKDIATIKKYSNYTPIFLSYNMNKCFINFMRLVKKAKYLFKKFDFSILDIHHKLKKDKPSGSAIMLSTIIGKPDIASIRIGKIIGEHKIYICDDFNKITLSHEVTNKNCFYKEIKKICLFLFNKKKGLYSFK